MKYFFLFLVTIIICTLNFGVTGITQKESPIKVVSTFRTNEFYSESFSLKPKKPKKEIVLILKIEGISKEKFKEIFKKKEIHIIADKNKYEAGIWFSPIILTFSIPKKVLKIKLLVSDYPIMVFEAQNDISKRLNINEVR